MAISVAPSVNSNTVPYFLKAPTAQRLWDLMRLNNQKLRGFVQYSNIQWIPEEKSWYAWYLVDVEKIVLSGGRINGSNSES